MVCQPVRIALLLGAITAVAVSPARAQSQPTPPPAAAAPTRTIQVTEMVPEQCTKKVVTYQRVCKTEQYQACKWVCTTECRERTCCVVKYVPVMTTVQKKVCKTVTVNEKRIVNKTCYKNVSETVQQKRLVELGHWECKERPALLGSLFTHGGGCGTGCATGCNTGCATGCNTGCNTCARTVSHKVWVYCPKYDCCPVQVCKRVCYTQPVEVCVPVCKRVEECVTCQVCTHKLVREQVTHKYNVPVLKKVAYTATRTVSCCQPVETTVNYTQMVPRCVTREVPCNTCDTCCAPRSGLFSGLFRTNGSCCR